MHIMKPAVCLGAGSPVAALARAVASRGRAGRVAGDKRIHIRFDMLFPCAMASELYGETQVVARNVSAGGMLVQTADVLPLGAW
jgi:hypothetical protein